MMIVSMDEKELILQMPVILPISELRDTDEICRICSERKDPIFLTRNGYGHLVVMSMESYEELTARQEVQADVHASLRTSVRTSPLPSALPGSADELAALDALWNGIRAARSDTGKQ